MEPTNDYELPHPHKHVPRNRYAERREREGELRVVQGLLLFSIYALFSDDKEKHKKGKTLLVRGLEVSFHPALMSMHHPSLAPRHLCCPQSLENLTPWCFRLQGTMDILTRRSGIFIHNIPCNISGNVSFTGSPEKGK